MIIEYESYQRFLSLDFFAIFMNIYLLSQISLFDNFSIVSFCSFATFCKLSNW